MYGGRSTVGVGVDLGTETQADQYLGLGEPKAQTEHSRRKHAGKRADQTRRSIREGRHRLRRPGAEEVLSVWGLFGGVRSFPRECAISP